MKAEVCNRRHGVRLWTGEGSSRQSDGLLGTGASMPESVEIVLSVDWRKRNTAYQARPGNNSHKIHSTTVHTLVTLLSMKDTGLRIRVQRDLRDRFQRVCRAQDKPVAQVLREFMRTYVNKHKELLADEPAASSVPKAGGG